MRTIFRLYVDPNNVSHGYVRALDGWFTKSMLRARALAPSRDLRFEHQPGWGDRGKLLGRERCVSRLPGARDGTITTFVASWTAMPPQIDSNHSELPGRETVNGLRLRERCSLCRHFLPESL